MESMKSLLNPKSIAVVGASQKGGRGTTVLASLKEAGFNGEVFAVNPKYQDILGFRSYPSVDNLPATVDCMVVAVAADAACKVLEEAYAHGIRAAVVLSSGFGEGGHGEDRAKRLLALAGKGMSICGPNCLGIVNFKARAAAWSVALPRLLTGPVALISQSGGLSIHVFEPLINDRHLGFSYLISCGNQLGTTIEDYIEYCVDDPEVSVIAVIVESLKNPRKLRSVARRAHSCGKSILFYRPGKSTAGQMMARSHTGALTGNAEIFRAFLSRCGIVQIDSYEQFVEAIELFGSASRDDSLSSEVIVISGSGGGCAVAADALDDAGMKLASLHSSTKEAIKAIMPEFGSISNPLDGTGVIYDDAGLLPKLYSTVIANPGRPIIAAEISSAVNVSTPTKSHSNIQRMAGVIAESAKASGRTVVAFQTVPLGGPLDPEIVATLHTAKVPLILGVENAMRVFRYLGIWRQYHERALAQTSLDAMTDDFTHGVDSAEPIGKDFMSTRQALCKAGVAVVEADIASSETEAVAIFRKFSKPVVIKAEIQGLLHKSDIGCVVASCCGEEDIRGAYRTIIGNARRAGFQDAQTVLIQPMVSGVAEVFAGIINDPLFGPVITFGLGGVFVEIARDTITEMAPISLDDAHWMIEQIKGNRILKGARGRMKGDVNALAELLVCLGQFAAANSRRFLSLDLNPIIVKPEGEGVAVVDIAIEFQETE